MLFLGTYLLYKLRCEGDLSLKLELLSRSVLLQRFLDSNRSLNIVYMISHNSVY